MITDTDLMSQEEAKALAEKLDAYWHSKGYPQARHWAEYVVYPKPHTKKPSETRGVGVWVVRSNLVNGWPPGPRTKPIVPTETETA